MGQGDVCFVHHYIPKLSTLHRRFSLDSLYMNDFATKGNSKDHRHKIKTADLVWDKSPSEQEILSLFTAEDSLSLQRAKSLGSHDTRES